MLKIHGRASSANVQSVMWTIAELELAHERLDIGGAFGGNNEAAFLKLNPNGLVPVMEGDGIVMFESNAIVRYLVEQYGKPSLLGDATIKDKAMSDVWMEWAKTTVYPVVIAGLFINLVRVKKSDRDERLMADLQQKAARLMAMAEAQLTSNEWLAGDTISKADIGFGSLLYRYFTLEFDRAELPALNTYYERLQARPAYRDHVMVDYSAMKVE